MSPIGWNPRPEGSFYKALLQSGVAAAAFSVGREPGVVCPRHPDGPEGREVLPDGREGMAVLHPFNVGSDGQGRDVTQGEVAALAPIEETGDWGRIGEPRIGGATRGRC